MWESRPVLAMIRFEHHQRPESRSFVGMATGLICIDTKGLLSIHRLIQMFCCHRRWRNHRVGAFVMRQGSL